MTAYDTQHPLMKIILKVSERYIVVTVTSINPITIDPIIYGQHCSYIQAGFRIWGFASHEGWLKFKQEYSEYVVPS